MMEISVVIPVYNAGLCLERLTDRIADALSFWSDYEVIYVDDGSVDNSWDIIKQIVSSDERVLGIRFKKNYGQDNAILSGLRLAKGEWIVIMDDDLQHDPAEIIRLYDRCKQGAGACYANFKEIRTSSWKKAGSWLNGKLAEKTLDKPGEMYLSPFKIIRREVVNKMILYKGPFPYIDGILLNATSNIAQIEILHLPSKKMKSAYGFLSSLKVFMKHLAGYSGSMGESFGRIYQLFVKKPQYTIDSIIGGAEHSSNE